MYINIVVILIVFVILVSFSIILPIITYNIGKNNVLKGKDLSGNWNVIQVEAEDDDGNWGGFTTSSNMDRSFGNYLSLIGIKQIDGINLGKSEYTIINNKSGQELLIGSPNINQS